MKNISLLFLAAFTAWAAAVVSRDIATRKIPNASIITGLKLLGLVLAVFAAYTWLGYAGRTSSFFNLNFYWLFALHLFWTVLAGVILWYAEVWPAGDAKFFMLVSAALPLANPYLRNFPSHLFLSLLINIFLAAAFWAVGSHIASGFATASPSDFFSERWRDIKKKAAELFSGKNQVAGAAYAVNLGFIFLLQQVMSLEARGFISRFFSRGDLLFFFLFILWDKIGGVFRNRRWIVISGASYLLYFFLGYFLFRERLWLMLSTAGGNVVKFSLLLFMGRFVLEFLMEQKDAVHLTASEVEAGTVLSTKSAREFRANPVFDGLFDDCFKDGMTEEQAAAVRDWLKKLPVRDPRIEAVRGRPFALWIFAGAVLQLVLDRNIAGLLK
jgi:hypothetical protein